MGNHRSIPVALGHFNGRQGFGEGADLVDFDQNGVAHSGLDAPLQTFGVGDKEVVSHQLKTGSQFTGQLGPALPVVFGQTVFDGNDGIALGQISVELNHFRRGAAAAIRPLEDVVTVFVKLAGGRIEGEKDFFAGGVPGLLYGLHDDVQGLVVGAQVRGKAAFVAHRGAEISGF